MTELLTASQMRAIEQAAIDSGEVTGLELMERAGRGVVEAAFEEWPELAQAPHRAVVVCGPGNNGGDGFVVARLLKEWGWQVEVFLYGDRAKLPPDARANSERWAQMGRVTPYTDEAFERELAGPRPADLLVDALFGTGLTRPVDGFDGFCRSTWRATSASHATDAARGTRVLAVDIPSGVCADSGRYLVAVPPRDCAQIRADLTVSFHREKTGHRLAAGPDLSGKVVVKNIGLQQRAADAHSVLREDIVQLVDRPDGALFRKHASAHKYSSGHALVLSGPPGAGGAARLAARGALRMGAGLVSVLCDDAAIPEHAAQLNAIMIKPVTGAGALADLLADNRLNAICLGPGLGSDRARDLVPVAMRAEHTPGIVLDADALTAYADAPDTLFGMLHEKTVLTPHAGEFARLFPDLADKLTAPPGKGPAYSKIDATRDAAKRTGCTILFKGPDTVIASPDGRASINSAQYDRAAPWLATAGSGDVLAGFITGLLARGVVPHQAAETAAWLHVDCALGFGPGLIAEDLPEGLPQVFRALGV
jgi:hydroxyethylthiazole kinase-like uncharacterized protein yjeF